MLSLGSECQDMWHAMSCDLGHFYYNFIHIKVLSLVTFLRSKKVHLFNLILIFTKSRLRAHCLSYKHTTFSFFWQFPFKTTVKAARKWPRYAFTQRYVCSRHRSHKVKEIMCITLPDWTNTLALQCTNTGRNVLLLWNTSCLVSSGTTNDSLFCCNTTSWLCPSSEKNRMSWCFTQL